MPACLVPRTALLFLCGAAAVAVALVAAAMLQAFCCGSSTHCVSWCTCVINAAMFSSSAMLRERSAVTACCCCGPCGRSKPTLRYHASGEHAMTPFHGHLSQRVRVGMIVLCNIKCCRNCDENKLERPYHKQERVRGRERERHRERSR